MGRTRPRSSDTPAHSYSTLVGRPSTLMADSGGGAAALAPRGMHIRVTAVLNAGR